LRGRKTSPLPARNNPRGEGLSLKEKNTLHLKPQVTNRIEPPIGVKEKDGCQKKHQSCKKTTQKNHHRLWGKGTIVRLEKGQKTEKR